MLKQVIIKIYLLVFLLTLSVTADELVGFDLQVYPAGLIAGPTVTLQNGHHEGGLRLAWNATER